MAANAAGEDMDSIAGLTTTGRRIHGPASDLVELVAESGLRHTAVVFHPEYRESQAINSALSVVLGYLESPMVTGMVELVAHEPQQGAFVYPTGQASSVAEINRAYADLGEAPGTRAGLEFMYAAGEILTDASETGETHGVYSHGGLTPWRALFKPDGQVQIIGYGLPQVEILQFLGDSSAVPREDSFRYCPPERLEGGAEDLRSDIFSLALIAFELMTGKPMYDGLVNDIRAMASRAEGSRRLFRFRDLLPKQVQDFLKLCLRRDMDDRFHSGREFLDAVRAVMGGPGVEGPSLMDAMARLSAVPERVGTKLDSGATMMINKDKLTELLEGEEEEPSKRTAWKPPSRSRRTAPRVRSSGDRERPGPTPAPAPEPEEQAAPPAEERAEKWKAPSRARPGAPRRSEEAPESASQSQSKWRRPTRRPKPRRPAEAEPEELPAARPAGGTGAEEPAAAEKPEAATAAPAKRRAASLAEAITGGGARVPPRRRPPARRKRPVSPAPEPEPVESAPPVPKRSAARLPPRLAAKERLAEKEHPREKAPTVDALRDSGSAPPPPPPPPGNGPPPPPPELTASQSVLPAAPARAEPPPPPPPVLSPAATAPEPPAQPVAEELAAKEPAVKEPVEEPVEEPPAPPPAAESPPEEAQEPPPAPPPAPARKKPVRRAKAAVPVAKRKRPVPRRKAEPLKVMTPPVPDDEPDDATTVVPLRKRPAPRSKPAAEPPAPRADASAPSAPSPTEETETAPVQTPAAPARPAGKSKRPAPDAAAPPRSQRVAAKPRRAEAKPEGASASERAPAEGALETSAASTAPLASVLRRPVDAVPSERVKSGTATFTLLLAPGAKQRRFRLPQHAPCSEAVARLLGLVLPVRTDTSGRIAGWYRFAQEGKAVLGASSMDEVDADKPLELVFVENQVRSFAVEVRDGSQTTILRLPLGTALPSCSIVDAIADMLSLPAGPWRLHLGDRKLFAHEILVDSLSGAAGSTPLLVVAR